MKQPNAREFVEKSEKYGNIWRKVAIATCRECGETESIGISQNHALLPAHAIQKKFNQKGWTLGSNEHWDICPDCTERKKHQKPNLTVVKTEDKETEMKIMNTPAAPSAEPPRIMQRDDRRIIFQKLNEVYLDEKRGYDNGWSDLKVSTDLGVPRAWVAQVRDENFGPVGSNPDIDEFKKGLEELDTIKNQIGDLRTMLVQLDINVTLQKILRLEKLGTEVQKHIP